MKRLALVLALGLPVAAASGCTGSIGDGGASPGAPNNGNTGVDPNTGKPTTDPGTNNGKPGTTPGTTPTMDPTMPPSAEVACSPDGKDTIGRRTLRRLTNAEFEATIRTTFGLTTTQWAGLTVPPDRGSADGFNNNVDSLKVSNEYAIGASESGRKVAALITSDAMLGNVLPCAATGGTACADTFLGTIGAKLYRRPLAPTEKARFMALFDKVSKTADFKTFVYWATATMLQSPNVIYRSELGEADGPGRFKLSPYEVASELAYNFTGQPPTPALLALAAANKLSTADEIEAAARGMLMEGGAIKPAFRDVFMKFSEQWLGLSGLSNLKKDAMSFPDYNNQVQDALGEETRQFFSAVVIEDKGSVDKLFTAPYTVINPLLAKFYGFAAGAGNDFARVNRPPNWGVGLLAQGSILSVKANSLKTSPTKRGHLVRTNVMCGVVPPPPPTVAELPPPTEAETTRQRYEKLHAPDPACSACHTKMDPIGFAFEHLDATGRYRAKEGNFDIDDTGVLTETSKGDLKFKGANELATMLSTLPEVADCMGSYMAAYTFGVSQENASCLVRSVIGQLKTGKTILDVYLGLSRADHFRVRQP
jgi:hypothetical protein